MAITVLKLGWEFPPNNWGGLGVACYGVVGGLIENQIKVILVLPNKQKNILKKCKLIHAKSLKNDKKNENVYKNLYTNLFNRINYYAKSCQKLVEKEKFDLIHAHDWMTFKSAIKLKKITGKPLVVHVHSTEVDRQGYKNKKQKIYDIEKNGMQLADKVFAVSNYTKKRIIRYYKIDPNKIEIMHNAISITNGKNKLKIENEIKKRSLEKIKASRNKKILFLGRLTAQKGPEYFIKAALKVLQHRKDVEFIIAGDGDMKSKLQKEVHNLGISKKVFFAGFLKGDLVDLAYKISDIYVMPSVCEPFGLAPLESIKNNTPVIISKNAGVCEVINNCLKINFSNTEQIANQILKLINSPDLYKSMVEKGRKEINKLTWDCTAQKCIKIYKQLVDF
ncbi:glycosyltransferase [Candidatus Dependentiae bacterium]|nr:glycosyltransferase [Candidatus Dependentiae bacterium]